MSILIVRDEVREPLYAVVPYFNWQRWKSRVKHTERALKHFHDSGAVIVFVEIAFNRREFAFDNVNLGLDGTSADCGIAGTWRHKHIQIRTKDELWLKENAINLGVASLPHDWQQVCWLDSDIHFVRPNWVGECIHQLQHYKFLQMFSHAQDLSPTYETLPMDYPHSVGAGWVRSWLDDKLPVLQADGYYGAGAGKVWPGLAWAATRQAWDEVGGLIDVAIWGGGDWHMSHALIGKRDKMLDVGLHPHYKQVVTSWADRCDRYIRRNVGCMSGSVFHNWHGRKTERGYGVKHRMLGEVGFDPTVHLKRDFQGLWQLNDTGDEDYIKLRDLNREIAKDRSEDSIDLYVEPDGQGH